MTRHDIDPPPLQDPLAEIERHLMAASLAGADHDLNELLTRTDEEAHALLAEASRYASACGPPRASAKVASLWTKPSAAAGWRR